MRSSVLLALVMLGSAACGSAACGSGAANPSSGGPDAKAGDSVGETVSDAAAADATGTPCKNGNECGTEGSCVPDSTGTLRCAPMPGAGQNCLFECQTGLYCNKGVTAATCQPPICEYFYKLK